EDDDVGEIVVSNGVRELLTFGATAMRFSGIAVLLGLVIDAVAIGPAAPAQVEATEGFLSGLGGLALLVALGSGAWLVGTLSAVANHHGFTLRRTPAALVAAQGLLTTRQAVLRLSKVQVVSIIEPWLRRWFGFASVTIETAAAREGGEGIQQSEAMVPYARPVDVDKVVEAAMPQVQGFRSAQLTLTPPHRLALVRSLAASVTQSGLFAAAVGWWFFPYGLLALLTVPIAIASAVLDHRYQGWSLDDKLIVSRRGYLDRRTWLLSRDKIQATAVVQGPILRRYGLGILQVRVAGSVVSLPAMRFEEATGLQARLLDERRR
ncbi:MAG: PH domain-containing protein, partial [Myxococcota bacterium]